MELNKQYQDIYRKCNVTLIIPIIFRVIASTSFTYIKTLENRTYIMLVEFRKPWFPMVVEY